MHLEAGHSLSSQSLNMNLKMYFHDMTRGCFPNAQELLFCIAGVWLFGIDRSDRYVVLGALSIIKCRLPIPVLLFQVEMDRIRHRNG